MTIAPPTVYSSERRSHDDAPFVSKKAMRMPSGWSLSAAELDEEPF